MTSGDYKIQKEAFHSFNNGDTVLDINKICWTAIVGDVGLAELWLRD